MLLLFRRGQRPDAAALRAAARAADRIVITHEFLDRDVVVGAELLRDGMTYDVTGLAPADAIAVPAARHRYGFDSPEAIEAIALRPGPHLAAGAHSIPVVRTMSGVAAELLATLPGAVAVAWPPARAIIESGFFAASVAGWLGGGAFPVLGFTAFEDAPGGGMLSEGLAWFTGRELLIAPDLARDRAAAARLAIRLVSQLASQGRLVESEIAVAPDGSRLVLEPTRDGNTVRVRRG